MSEPADWNRIVPRNVQLPDIPAVRFATKRAARDLAWPTHGVGDPVPAFKIERAVVYCVWGELEETAQWAHRELGRAGHVTLEVLR